MGDNTNTQQVEEEPVQASLITEEIAPVKAKKVDKYVVQEWAVEPLKELRGEDLTAKQRLVNISMNLKLNVILLRVEGETSRSTMILTMTIYESGIVHLKCHNDRNTWKFQVDDVVGELNLKHADIKTQLSFEGLVAPAESVEIGLNGKPLLRIIRNPFKIILSQQGETAVEVENISCDGWLSAKTTIHSAHIYGIPEHPDSYDLNDTTSDKPYRLYNLDRYLWPIHSKGSLYGTAPILVGHNASSSTTCTSGIFWRNTTETYIDVKKGQSCEATWLSEQGEMELVLFAGSSVKEFYGKLSSIVGYSQMPQLFALGYQHSRYSFKDQTDVQDVDDKFDSLGIPYDVIYLDIDHCYKKRYFSFDESLYPTVDSMIARLEKKGRKIVTIVDPHVLIDEEYYVYSESKTREDFFIQNPEEKDGSFVGKCWPGDCHWLDFLNADVRKYWASLYAYSKYEHSTPSFHTWNDMNEPAVFKGIEETMVKENMHTISRSDGLKYHVPHTFAHNLYGLTQAQASHQGLVERDSLDKQRRPLVLTRSWWVGSQKYAAIWTADSEATWEYLQIHTPMLLTFSSVGFPFCGGDVGGFEGNPTEDLHVRWYQVGAFQPFFRGHSSTFCDRREPWLYSDSTCSRIRAAIRTRYEFLAVWYATFFEHVNTGMPVMRALWQNFPTIKEVFAEEQTYMIGDNILVAPVIAEGQKEVSLCGLPGTWFEYSNGYKKVNDTSKSFPVESLDVIPVFFKAGAAVLLYNILENKNTFKSSEEIREKCSLQLIVCVDNDSPAAVGSYFMDDGGSFKFERNGEFCGTHLKFANGQLEVSVDNKLGDKYWLTQIEKVIVCGVEETPIVVEGLAIDLNKQGVYAII